MSINRWMDRKVVVHIHNAILLSHKKEHIWVSSNEVDEPRAYYTEWSKSEREKQILYINTYTRNLGRWYGWTYLQGYSGDTSVLLPGKSHGRRSLVGCSPWGREESDMTERVQFHFSLFTFIHWSRKWQPTPVFLPRESQSLVGCHPWGRTESDTTEAT